MGMSVLYNQTRCVVWLINQPVFDVKPHVVHVTGDLRRSQLDWFDRYRSNVVKRIQISKPSCFNLIQFATTFLRMNFIFIPLSPPLLTIWPLSKRFLYQTCVSITRSSHLISFPYMQTHSLLPIKLGAPVSDTNPNVVPFIVTYSVCSLTNIKQHLRLEPIWAASSRSLKSFCLVGNPKVYNRLRKGSSLVSIVSWTNPVHSLQPYFLSIYFIIIFSPAPVFPKCIFLSGYSPKIVSHFLMLV